MQLGILSAPRGSTVTVMAYIGHEDGPPCAELNDGAEDDGDDDPDRSFPEKRELSEGSGGQ